MSAWLAVFQEFKEKCKVKNSIITFTRKNNEFLICIYALQKDIDIKNEENKLRTLCYKHGICYKNDWGQHLWKLPELTEIILVRPTYCSTYVFSFKKKETESLFFLL